MIELALRSLLTDVTRCPGVAGAVGSRIYQAEAPQDPSYPLIVFHIVYDTSKYHMTGSDGLRRARIQVDCQALKQADADSLAEDVINEAGGFRGRVAGSPGIDIRGLFHLGGSDATGADLLPAGPGIGLKRVDLEIHLRR